MIRLPIHATAPDPAVLESAAVAIRSGGLVVVPTDTLYGLAADPFADEAVRRIFAVKDRSAGQALPLIAADTEQVVSFMGPLPAAGRQLAEHFWPGPLTLLLPAPGTMAAGVSGGTGRIGVRVPNHAVARGLCRACGRLLTATSANVSGQFASEDPDTVAESLGVRRAQIAVLLDAGKTAGGPPSTIVDVATGPGEEGVRLVRAGAIPWEDIQACLHP